MGDRLKTIESILNAPGEVFYGEIDEEGTVSQDVADAERDFNWLINQVKTLQEDNERLAKDLNSWKVAHSTLFDIEKANKRDIYRDLNKADKKIEQYEKALIFAKEYLEHSNVGQIQMVVSSINQALKEPTND
jgi:hypothetical protein